MLQTENQYKLRLKADKLRLKEDKWNIFRQTRANLIDKYIKLKRTGVKQYYLIVFIQVRKIMLHLQKIYIQKHDIRQK